MWFSHFLSGLKYREEKVVFIKTKIVLKQTIPVTTSFVSIEEKKSDLNSIGIKIFVQIIHNILQARVLLVVIQILLHR